MRRPDHDQFIRVESGHARVELGRSQDRVDKTPHVDADGAAIIPAGTWHRVVDAGADDVRLYSICAPPEHPDGTVHPTTANSLVAHEHQAD